MIPHTFIVEHDWGYVFCETCKLTFSLAGRQILWYVNLPYGHIGHQKYWPCTFGQGPKLRLPGRQCN